MGLFWPFAYLKPEAAPADHFLPNEPTKIAAWSPEDPTRKKRTHYARSGKPPPCPSETNPSAPTPPIRSRLIRVVVGKDQPHPPGWDEATGSKQ